MSKVLKIFENIIFTKGFGRTLVCDFFRNDNFFISNELMDFIEKFRNKNLSIKQEAENKMFLDFLLEKDIAFYANVEESLNFPIISNEFHHYSFITNTIIELNDNFEKIKKSIDLLNNDCLCYDFLFFSNDLVEFDFINKILLYFKNKPINSIDFYLKHDNSLLNNIDKIIYDYPYLRLVIFFECHDNKIYNLGRNTFNSILLSKKKLDFSDAKKSIDLFNFSLKHYTESLTFNTYFNRKMTVMKNGDIKNAPNTVKIYDNIYNDHVNIKKIIESDEFKKYWNLKKNDIETCKVCEFRNVCVDNRIPVTINSKLDFETTCNYSPFTMTFS